MKPVLYHIEPWDVDNGSCTIEYKWGGSVVDACRISVYTSAGVSAENLIAEFDIQQTFQTKFILDSTHGTVGGVSYKNYLSNGNRYICTINCHTADGWQEYSEGEYFYCYEMLKPTFSSQAITPDMVLDKQVLHTTLNYTYVTSKGDSMNTFELKLYEGKAANVQYNSIMYSDSGSAVDGKLTTEIKNGLTYVTWSKTYDINLITAQDSADFCIQAVVNTMHGAEIRGDLINFELSYVADSFSELELINYPLQGYISVTANLVAVEGHVFDPDGNEVTLQDGDFFLYPTDQSSVEELKRNYVLNLMSARTTGDALSIGDDENNVIDIRNDKYNMFFDVVDFMLDKPILELSTDYKQTFEKEEDTIGCSKFYIRYNQFMQSINGTVTVGPTAEVGPDGITRYWYTADRGSSNLVTFATSTNTYSVGQTIADIDVWCYYLEMINTTFLDTVIVHSNFFYKKPVKTAGQEQELKILFRRDPSGYYYLYAVVKSINTQPNT